MFKQLAFIVTAMAMLGGCAATRSVVSPEMGIATQNPAQGVAVRIDHVDDMRHFSSSPREADMPSLSESDVHDVALTSRAIARKRNGYGMALGDVLLPEGQTVSKLIANAVSQGFRRAGYRVLTKDDPNYAQAVPVNARINEFWSWDRPGFGKVTVYNRADVTLVGELPALSGGPTVRTEIVEPMQLVLEDDWREIIGRGLGDLVEKVRITVAPVPPSP